MVRRERPLLNIKVDLEPTADIIAESEREGTSDAIVDRIKHEKSTVERSDEVGDPVGRIRLATLPYDAQDGGGINIEPFWRTLYRIRYKDRIFVVVGDAPETYEGSDITRNAIYIGRGESLKGAVEDLALAVERHNRTMEYELDSTE